MFDKLSLTWWANTLVIRSIVNTRGSILACAGSAGVVLVLAADTGVSGRAGAVKAGAEVPAEASVHAGAADATFRSCLTSFAVGALGAAEIQNKNG